jgi:hypothetical protein
MIESPNWICDRRDGRTAISIDSMRGRVTLQAIVTVEADVGYAPLALCDGMAKTLRDELESVARNATPMLRHVGDQIAEANRREETP